MSQTGCTGCWGSGEPSSNLLSGSAGTGNLALAEGALRLPGARMPWPVIQGSLSLLFVAARQLQVGPTAAPTPQRRAERLFLRRTADAQSCCTARGSRCANRARGSAKWVGLWRVARLLASGGGRSPSGRFPGVACVPTRSSRLACAPCVRFSWISGTRHTPSEGRDDSQLTAPPRHVYVCLRRRRRGRGRT